MTEQEKDWLAELTKDRRDNAATLDKPSMRGVQRSVVDKYSDQAHFIYELLQNADDAKATSAKFILEPNGLYFVHDGKVCFTVSNPNTEDEDSKLGKLGHINAITSIANSSKTNFSIGKFGVGFKAVFQYTQTPHIYDPMFRFKIERFIIPYLLDSDLHWRHPTETVFWFPFDHKDKSPEESYEDILEKLKKLDFPILFLSNLKAVQFQAVNFLGTYSKTQNSQVTTNDFEVQRLSMDFDLNGEKTRQDLLLFSRRTEIGLPYSIGFAISEMGRLTPIVRPAYCFFPTKETTNLNFIVHAAFLLTDSRESIKAGEKHNLETIQQLAALAADSLPFLRDQCLIDDDIFEILPYDQNKFGDIDDRSKLSFRPFWTKIQHKFQTDSLLPAGNHTYVPKHRAYWASDTALVRLLSDDQLAHLTGTKDAVWVFRNRGKKDVQNGNKALADFIDGGITRTWQPKESNLIRSSLDPEAILKRISSDFIVLQSHDWLHEFYAYLADRPSYQKAVKDKPIFRDRYGRAVPAFDAKGHLVLFLPDDDLEGYTTVDRELLRNKETYDFVVGFGVTKPSLHDEIYNRLLPQYLTKTDIDAKSHFIKFFRYFKECRNSEVDGFLNLIREKSFVYCTTMGTSDVQLGKADEIYFPSADLIKWFATKPDAKFLSSQLYRTLVSETDRETVDLFFKRLGVAAFPRVLIRTYDLSVSELKKSTLTKEGRSHKLRTATLDGLDQLLDNISEERSILLWRILSTVVNELRGVHTWFYHQSRQEYFESSVEKRLKSYDWILNQSGQLVSSSNSTTKSLSEKLFPSAQEAEVLIKFLAIRDELLVSTHLTDDEARKIRIADEIERSGLSEAEIRAAIEHAKLRKVGSVPAEPNTGPDYKSDPKSPLIKDIEERRRNGKARNATYKSAGSNTSAKDENPDTDEFIPKTIEFGSVIERAKDRFANELDRLERKQLLLEQANSLPRYSYGWFLALLELECLASEDKNSDSKTIAISFGKLQRDEESARTIILKQPSRFIPQSLEELSGVRVDLDFGDNRTKHLHVESFTVREFCVLGRIESRASLDGLDLSNVLEARIEIQNPAFLQQELLERYRELKLETEVNMKLSLTPNIEFVFGPPGTGKTTYLAEKVLIPRIKFWHRTKILVLTPTNKAADVLTHRILEKMGDDQSYLKWLVRFGTSSDERIEKSGVRRDRSFNAASQNQLITITTIARFAYDGFSGEKGQKLHEMDWDLIVFDEASMIPLANIVYPLYRFGHRKFLVAGDPFQIEPIVAVEQWKGENIYSMVGLNKAGAFAKPETEPYDYVVTNLDIQYRSTPEIGEVFSRFTYDGILKHHRKNEPKSRLLQGGDATKQLNLIKFPVSKYESIYRAKRLQSGTPYQIYSALFTFEFCRWLAGQVQGNSGSKFRIGIIAPYRAQASILDRLCGSWQNKPENLEVQVGTIHGFQGDECDAIIAVMNPPPHISQNSQMFLNKQNIINVAISRARDYLFLVLPDDDIVGHANLHKLRCVEELVKSSGDWQEFKSHELEHLIFGNPNYLEENTFSTGHQMVNVYLKPEKYYEVRSDETAIDVQIFEQRTVQDQPKTPTWALTLPRRRQ